MSQLDKSLTRLGRKLACLLSFSFPELSQGTLKDFLPGSLVSYILPHLVTLRLYGTEAAVSGSVDLIGPSSPPHTVLIHFCHIHPAVFASAIKKMLAAYCECREWITPAYQGIKGYLVFRA